MSKKRDYLNFKDLQFCFESGIQIDWHDEYQHKFAADHPDKCILTEEWKDRLGPLTIVRLSTMTEKDSYVVFVGYLCSDPNCRVCMDKTLIVKGHHKILQPNGIDISERVEFIETKKKTVVETTKQPVFKRI